MPNEPTDIHGPTADAPFVTNLYARCAVCQFEWQLKGENLDDARGCPGCNVGDQKGAITICYEGPEIGGFDGGNRAAALAWMRGRR